MKTKLKPCPFCDQRPIPMCGVRWDERCGMFAKCSNPSCKIYGIIFDAYTWNTRPGEDRAVHSALRKVEKAFNRNEYDMYERNESTETHTIDYYDMASWAGLRKGKR